MVWLCRYAVCLFLWLPLCCAWRAAHVRAKYQRRLLRCSATEESKLWSINTVGSVNTLTVDALGQNITFETGKIGRQANGAIHARLGDTMVYATVCAEDTPQAVDFSPLRVDYFERFSAAGKTINSYTRRDCRGGDHEILRGRLIDRPIRPMMVEGWRQDTQLMTWVTSYDGSNTPEALAICAASAAMCVSDVPMQKPVAGVVVGKVDGSFIVNPTYDQLQSSDLHLTLAGTKDGILMIEGAANFLTEEEMTEAISAGHQVIRTICEALEEFQARVGKAKQTANLCVVPPSLYRSMRREYTDKIDEVLSQPLKSKQDKMMAALIREVVSHYSGVEPVSIHALDLDSDDDMLDDDEDLVGKDDDLPVVFDDDPDELVEEISDDTSIPRLKPVASKRVATKGISFEAADVKIAYHDLCVERLRHKIRSTGKRTDGRDLTQVRPISIEMSLLPGAHGSSLFTRGDTQALATATLGSSAMDQRTESLEGGQDTKSFYLQYRFPPSSVGEVGRFGSPGRREVGHGNLAERALQPAIPDRAEFPYTVRVESLITESSGSSSMATVCGCCMAMIDAGIPLTTPIAGVAMGLLLGSDPSDEPLILTDILGLEDALGTMDFKVAGNESGITTFQLDIKCEGLTIDLLTKALKQAKQGRLRILDIMRRAAKQIEDRPVAVNLPRVTEFTIDASVKGKIIGSAGKTIKQLIENYNVTNISLKDDGTIQIESDSFEKNKRAKQAILDIAEAAAPAPKKTRESGPAPVIGTVYRQSEIKKLQPFGVFVELAPGNDGLVHVSELDTKRVPSVEEAFKVGDKIDVKLIAINEKGQLRLSRRVVIMEDAQAQAEATAAAQKPTDNIIPTNTNTPAPK